MIRIIREDPDRPQPEPEPEPEPEAPPPPRFPGATLAGLGAAVIVFALAAFVLLGAGSESGSAAEPTPTFTPRPTATPTPVAQGLRQQAETQHLPRMSQALADLVRSQPWYQELTPAKLNLIAGLLKCEQAAKSKGEPKAAAELFQFATEQDWYADGLDDREATGLAGVVQAYERSLTKTYAPAIGGSISSTLRNQLFDVTTLPETGEKTVIIASKDAGLGRKALQIVTEYLPQLEGITGKFPYPFIYVEVVPDLPEEVRGLSYDEFIEVGTTSVNVMVISHELTHSTVYGQFPIWFEEGLAYFLGYYLSDSLASGASSAAADLRQIGAANKVDITNYGYYSDWDYIAETRRGFLFVKSLYDIEGIEGLSATIKALRTKTYNDNELLAAILQYAPEDKQTALKKLYCDRVAGTTRNYCVAGQ